MKKFKRLLAGLLAAMLLAVTVAPTAALAADTAASAPASSVTVTPGPSASEEPADKPEPSESPAPSKEPEESPAPSATPEGSPSPTETPEQTPAPSAEPEGTPGPGATPEPSESPAPSEEPEETPEPGEEPAPTEAPAPTEPVEIVEMTGVLEAQVGDTVTFSVKTSREEGVSYQWQRLYTPPVEEPEAIYPYGEGESTDYYFPIEGMTEAEVLAENPDAVWPGIEIYYAELEKLAQTPRRMSAGSALPEIHIENGTHNYVLEPEEDEAAPETGRWEAIAGETAADFEHTVTQEDEYTSYRCVVTVEQPEETPALTEEPAPTAAPEQKEEAQPEEEAAPAEEEPEAAEEEPEAAEEAEPEQAEPARLVSDSMYVELPQPAAQAQRFAAPAPKAAPAVALSEDGQWLTGMTSDMEYITAETYAAQGGEAAGNAWWTRLSGGARADGTKYVVTTLTDGKMEVLSAWYGRTVYVRYQGQSGMGTAIEIPAYTDPSCQSGQSFLYKKAIKVFNAWVADTGASFYATYLQVAVPNGNTPDGGHITIDRATIDSFNRQPKNYLTNAEGDYIYDAVIIGAATNDEPDLSGAAAWVLADYIDQGYGFLIGHDMIYGYGGVAADPDYTPDPNSTVTPYYKLNTLENGHYNMAWLMGRNEHYSAADPYSAASMILCGGDYRDKSTLYGDNSGRSLLEIRKSGDGDPLTSWAARTPTNYPYSAGSTPFSVGGQIVGTPTHSNQQVAYGTIWVNYASNGLTSMGAGRLITDTKADGLVGTNNFYLTTNGNLAMSQIGHTKGNKDIVRIDECYILANTLFYISQRQQCQVCQSQQSDNSTIHIVKKIRTAEELANLANPDLWFTYPLDGCYMLVNDIQLPADWQPIEGFDGHFDADGHSVTFSADLPEENRRVFASTGDGWALGEDKAQGVDAVYDGDAKTTGVARVVGYLSALLGDADSWQGYRVEIDGTDGVTYSCITNRDGKYVISNLPVTGVMEAHVYDAAGRELTELGTLAVTIPDGSGMVTPEGRSQDFWLSAETTAIYPLEYTALPPQPVTRWVGQSGDFTATILTSEAYPEDKIVWQYNDGSGWKDLEGSGVEYSVEYLGQVDTGDAMTTGTQTRLVLENLPLSLDGVEVRIRYEGNRVKEMASGSAAATVRKPELSLTMTGGQTVYVSPQAADGTKLDYAVPASTWPDLFGKEYPDGYKEKNNGNNQASYTSEILYLPELDERSTPELTWYYRSGNNTVTETPFGSCRYNAQSGEWETTLEYATLKRLHPELQFTIETSQPVPCTEDGTPDPEGEWRKITSTLLVDGADTSMDVGNTHFFFRCAAENEYGSGKSLYRGKANSPDADLTVSYTLDILPNQGKAVYGNGQAAWTFPDLEVIAPNGLRTAILTFFEPGHSTKNDIVVRGGNPYGIEISYDANDYVIFKSASGDLIPQEDWQAFFREYISFVTFDPKDANVDDISWYIAEEDEAEKFCLMLFDGTTNGWTGSGEKNAPIGTWPYGPSSWNGQNETVSYKGLTGGAQLAATLTSSSSWKSPSYNWEGGTANYYNIRGWNMVLTKSFDATAYTKLYLDAAVSSPSSNGITNAIALATNTGTVTISGPQGGRTPTTTNGLKMYDISAVAGTATLKLTSTAATGYALQGHREPVNVNLIGVTETVKLIVNSAYALANNFERTDKSAIRYSEIYANNAKIDAAVTLTPDPEKVYDGQPSKAVLTVTAGSEAQKAEIMAGSVLVYSKDGQPVEECIDQGTYTATASFSAAVLEKYDLAGVDAQGNVTATIKINPRPLHLQGKYLDDPDDPANIKTYDGTTEATVANVKISNIVPGDPVGLDKDRFAGVYATANAGETLNPDGTVQEDRYAKLTENPITRTEDIRLVNDPEGNYYIASEDYSGAIYRRPISAFVGNFTSVYGEDPALDPQTADEYSAAEGGDGYDLGISALVAGDTLTINPARSGFVLPPVDAGSDAGVYEVGYEGLTEANYPVLSNYIVWYQPGTLTIGPRPLIISAGEYTKVYGDPMPEFEPVYDGLAAGDTPEDLAGEPVFACDAGEKSPVGSYEVTVSGITCPENGNGAYNYTIYFRPGTLEITRRPIIITPDGPGTEPEDPVEVDQVANVTVEKSVDKDVLAVGESAAYTILVTNTGTVELTNLPVQDSHDGAGAISAAGGQGYTYDGDGTFTIQRLPVGKSVAITYTYTAVEADAGKTLTNVAVAKVPGANPEDPDNPGQGIDPEKPIDPDKEVPSEPVEVPVDPDKEPEPAPQPETGRSIKLTKTPDLAFAKPGDTITYTVVVTNDGAEDLADVTVRDKPTNFAGEPQPVPGAGYTVAADGSCSIGSLPVGASVTLSYTYQVQEADAGRNLRNVMIGTIPGTNPPDPADPDNGVDPEKPIDPDKDVPSNEAVVPVDPAGGVAADPQWKVYGDEDPELTYTLPEELVNPEDIWGELERVPGEEVGSYVILQGTLTSENYDITYIPNYLVIVPAPLTIRADDKARPYGQENPPLTVSYSGFKFDDGPEDLDGELSVGCPADAASEPGRYPITASGLFSRNYTITWLPGTLTVWDRLVGVIEVDRPGSDAVYGPGEVWKEYPQTGDELMERTWAADDADAAPLLVLQDGQLYLRKSQQEVKTEARTEKKVYENLTEREVPASLQIEENGQLLELPLEIAAFDDTPGKLTAQGTIDHGYLTAEPAAPAEKDITYTDPDTGLAQTIRGRLTATEQTEPWAWRQVELPIRYYGDESYEIFQLDDTYIPYDTDAPYWHGTDELVLDHLALDRDSYRLIGSEWTSGWVLDEDGRAVRHGVLYAEVWCAKWVSTYEAQTDIPLYRATAVYSLTGDELIVAQYAPLPLAVVVAMASVGVLLLAGLVIVILLLFAHRKKKGEEDNAGYNPLDQG